MDAANSIATWHRSALGSVKEVRAQPHASRGMPFHVGRFHLLLPLGGCFEWGDGRTSHVASSQHALYVPADRGYRVAHHAAGEHSLLLVPEAEQLDELGWSGGFDPRQVAVRSRTPVVNLAAQRLLWSARAGNADLAADELFLSLVSGLAATPCASLTLAAPSLRVVRIAKEYMHDRLGEPLLLADVAAAAGVSAIYLTNLFKRVEGVPLHQYLLRLRLAEAMERLPEADDLTGLAYDLGFSSHSHFTAAFRARAGTTPRQARGEADPRRWQRPLSYHAMCRARGGSGNDQDGAAGLAA